MKPVRISHKHAKAIHLYLCSQGMAGTSAAVELEAALTPSPKRQAVRKANRVAKESKRRTKRDETGGIYDAVSLRADDKCETCALPFTISDPPEMDHALGRGKVRQAVSNCWLIHRSCHRSKHAARPSRRAWLERMRDHFFRHGFLAEAAVVEDEMYAASMISRIERGDAA